MEQVAMVTSTTPLATNAPANDKALAVSPELAPLRGLATPSRRRGPSSLAGSPQSAKAGANGPAPWELQDATRSQPQQQQGGYRELLQLRGQNAMHRLRMQGSGVPPPPPTAAVTADASLAYAQGNYMCDSTMWCMNHDAAMQQQFQMGAQMDMSCHFQQMDAASVAWNSGGQLTLPIASRQDAALEQGAAFCQQAPSPWASQSLDASPSTTAGSVCSPQELMTTLMGSGAFGYDDEQIAQALRAAAPCEYED